MRSVALFSMVVAAILSISACGSEEERNAPINPATANQQAIKKGESLYKNKSLPSDSAIDKALAKYKADGQLIVAKKIAKDALLVCQAQGPYINCIVNLFPDNRQSVVIADEAPEAERLAKKSLAKLRDQQRQDEIVNAGPDQ